MRLIDADECFSKNYPSKYDLEKDDYAYYLISAQPTVEAIPVEQVAELLYNYVDKRPCFYKRIDETEFCKTKESCNPFQCWLNALREGWLDE